MKVFKTMEQLQIHCLLLLVMCTGLVMSIHRRENGDTPVCNIEDPALKRELTRCIKKGDRFMKRYFKALSRNKGPSGCSLFRQTHQCFIDLFDKCSASRNLLSPDWLEVYDVMDCQCSNDSQECAQAVPCFENEHKRVLNVRCDDYFYFNQRQNTRHHCHFVHENIQCKHSLVTSACGDYSGMFAFHLYKYKEEKGLSSPHHCPHLHRNTPYSGFRYSEQCPATFQDDLFRCEDYLFQNEVEQAFHDANDLVFAEDSAAVEAACVDFQRYQECRRPIKEKCPHGVKILEDYDERIRTLRMKLKFICEEKKESYVQNLPCYKTVIENGTLKLCNERFEALKPIMADVTAHQFYCTRNSNGTQRLLSALDDLRICYEETFVGACGTKGGRVMSGLMTEAFRDPMYLRYSFEPDCTLHTQDDFDRQMTTSGGGQPGHTGHSGHTTSTRRRPTDRDEPYTNPTRTQTKRPRKHKVENEVVDKPEVGHRKSSGAQLSTQKYMIPVTLTLVILWVLFPT